MRYVARRGPARFWSKVRLCGPRHPVLRTRCWEWVGGLVTGGYGGFKLMGKQLRAHRLSYAWNVGVVPEGLWVLHRCDNRRCVRPSHLFVGDGAANVRDMVAKGRNVRGDSHPSRLYPGSRPRGDSHWTRTRPANLRRGETHGKSKLTDSDVREIRRLYSLGGHTQAVLAGRYGVSRVLIGLVVRRKVWRHVGD